MPVPNNFKLNYIVCLTSDQNKLEIISIDRN